MNILARIDELRISKGWSVNQLAKQAGCKYSTINNLFERNNVPTIPTLEKICSAFGITMNEFFSVSVEPVFTDAQKEIITKWRELSGAQKKNLLPVLIENI